MPQQDFTQRAIAAYFRTGTKEGWRCDQPSAADSGTVELNNRHYVVLANSRGILAVYRIKPDGLLRRLKRWPHALNTGEHAPVTPSQCAGQRVSDLVDFANDIIAQYGTDSARYA